jgi:hypothetical protein
MIGYFFASIDETKVLEIFLIGFLSLFAPTIIVDVEVTSQNLLIA